MSTPVNLNLFAQVDGTIYDEYVSGLADASSDLLIPNGQPEHARALIRNLLSHAKSEVCIFTGHLNKGIYCDSKVMNAAMSLLVKGGVKLRILIQDADNFDATRPFVKLCVEGPGDCEIKQVIDSDDKEIKEHMVVMDSQGFRFCPDRDDTSAVASFNRPEIAANLAKQFDVLWTRASMIAH